MQNDLISREQSIKALRNYAEQKFAGGEVELANGILKAVCFLEKEENVPTAYDVDKVAAELEDKMLTSSSAKAEAVIGMLGESANFYGGEIEAYKNAIDIAKGGVEDATN